MSLLSSNEEISSSYSAIFLSEFTKVFNIPAKNLNDELAYKIEQDICQFKKKDDYEGAHQTCPIKEDLNLIITIDISRESRPYYRSFSIAIIQEILRAFEFKFDEQNLINERFHSRIRVFGIKKPRRKMQKVKLFDTYYDSVPLVDGITKIENWLNKVEVELMDPHITQSSGVTPKADDVVAFLRKFYEKEKRLAFPFAKNEKSPKPVTKIIHLQNTGSNKGRSPRSALEFVEAKPIYPILMATSDFSFEESARKSSFGKKSIFRKQNS